MKKKIFSATTILTIAMMSLSSCLKDASFVDLSKVGTTAEFPNGGLSFFAADALTASGIVTKQLAINIASPNVPTTGTTVTVGVDNSVIATYVAANPAISYIPVPAAAYTFPDQTVTIPAGSRTATFTMTIDKTQLDPSKSYMLPIVIKSAAGCTISGNMGIHYYHVIGNDFAGPYSWDFTRIPAAGNFVGHSTTLSPVSPTQFEVAGGYFTANVRYECTFTKNGNGTYSNFQTFINTDDITNILNANGIAVTVNASIVYPGYNPATQYTFTQATTGLFTFQYQVLGGSGARTNTDKYYH